MPEEDATEKLGDTPRGPPAITASDLAAVQIELPLAGVEFGDCRDFMTAFMEAANSSTNEVAKRVYGAFNSICSFHLRVSDPASPYGPMFEMEGRRALIPEDFRGDQNSALATIFDTLKHPALRARVADMVWLNDRQQKRAAEVAVSAYTELVEKLDRGELKHRFEPVGAVSRRSMDYVERALRIAASSTKDQVIPDTLKAVALRLVDRCEALGDVGGFERTCRLCRYYGLLPATDIASRAALLEKATPNADPMSRRDLLLLKARALTETGDEPSARLAKIEAAEMFVRMGDGMGSSGSKAHWYMEAIRELRSISGTKERRKELEVALRDAQRDALDEMGRFSVPLEIKEIVDQTESVFGGLALGEALRQLALISQPRALEDLKRQVDEIAADAPLSGMFAMTHVDARDGKVIGKSEGAPAVGQASAEWYERQICQNDKLHRQLVIAGNFEPARLIISGSYNISERHFQALVDLSPFVPADYQHIFALGFARMLQGDFTSAVYLLLPQLENSLRYVLTQVGADPTMIQSDMAQEDRSLGPLLEAERSTLDRVFGDAMMAEIDRLFNSRAGPALRHEVAHGKLSAGHCYTPDAKYACWLIYQLTCVPVIQDDWDNMIAPAIETEI